MYTQLIVIISDVVPFPTMFVANTVTLMSMQGGQDELKALYRWLQIPSSQRAAEMVAELQMVPERESKYIIV